MHENDEIASQLDDRVRTGHGKEFVARQKQLAALYFTVEEVYDRTPRPESAGKRIS